MVVKFGVPTKDRTLKRSTFSFYGMYKEYEKIQIRLWYILGPESGLCILFVFFECSNFAFKKCSLKIVYQWMNANNACVKTVSSWVCLIKEQLHCLGLGYIWNYQNCINSHDYLIQNLHSKIQCESKCYMYKYLVDNFCFICT